MEKKRLSSFGAEQIKAAREKREAEDRAKKKQYEQFLEAVQQQREQSGSKFIAAAKNGELFSATGNLCSWLYHHLKMLPLPPRESDIGIAERRFESGIFGEDQVERHIEAEVDQKRLVFSKAESEEDVGVQVVVHGSLTHSISGYRNRKGEIDLLIVSPWGVTAIEVKNVAGLVYTRGAEWFRDQYSKAGHLCRVGVPMNDRGGRSPVQQLNAPTDLLEEMLARHGHSRAIRRVVALAHPGCQIGDIDFDHNRVDMVANVARLDLVDFQLNRMTELYAGPLEADEIEQISALIQADFADFERSLAHRN